MSLSSTSPSQDDSNSLNSRSSSIDFGPDFGSTHLNNKERLGHIDSAIKWIKNELASMRDNDKTILQYLTQAQSCIKTIHGQHQHSLKVNRDVEKRHLFGSTEDLNSTMLSIPNGSSNIDKYGTLVTNTTRPPGSRGPLRSSGELCTSPTMLAPVTLSVDDQLLSSFLGEENAGKFASKPQKFLFEERNAGKEQETAKESSNKKENRNSAVSEIQRLRHQLQEQTKKDLENFDKAFDTPKVHPEVSEGADDKKYRYSILNRMDEILNNKFSESGSGHVRQYSEPLMMTASVSEYALSQKKPHPKNDFHSFRYPPSSIKPSPMVRSDSAGIPKPKVKPNVSSSSTHYDTTVVGKRRSRPSSRNSTLERQHKHPTQYSVNSLNENSGSDLSMSSESLDRLRSNRHSSISSEGMSPEIHPELSAPLSPLLNHIDPFTMMPTNNYEEYIRSQIGTVDSTTSKSAPLSRKNGIAQGRDISWL